MADGIDCSVWMSFDQFMREHVAEPDFPEQQAEEVRDAFLKTLNLEDGAGGLSAERFQGLLEKNWSQAWYTVARDPTLATKLCPGFVLHLSEDTPSSDDTERTRIDGSLIAECDKQRIKPKEPNWNLQRLPIEFKRSGASYDPFDHDPGRKHESSSEKRRSVYGQLMTYAARVIVNQHRKHLFLLFINGPKFRVMLFDHGGVATSESIDYISTVEGTAALLAFLYAFSKLGPAGQGIDTTVVALSPESCGYKRMDELKAPQKDDVDHHPRFVANPSTIPSSVTDSSNPPVVVDAQDTHLHRDPTHECKGLQCHDDPPAVVPVFTYVRDAFRRSIKPGEARYVVKVGQHHYLIGRYTNDPPAGLIGRGTKGYVALEWETQRFVFLKDTWRSYYVDIKQEGEILQQLNDQGVPYVPTVIAHGDVEDQETETSNYSPLTGHKKVEDCLPYLEGVKEKKKAIRLQNVVGRMKPNPKNVAGSGDGRGTKRTADDRIIEENSQQGQGLRHLIHYRLVVKEICLPLTEFKSSQQLVSIIMNCIVAHQMAHKKCHLIHRDVSFGNILIQPRMAESQDHRCCIVWQGLLADWELAKDFRITRALQPERTGTWYFMSWYILAYGDRPITIPDELESFVHVLIYAAARLVDHNFPDIRGFINDYFDSYSLTAQNDFSCPLGKCHSITNAKLNDTRFNNLVFRGGSSAPGDHPLNKLVHELLALIRSRYIVLEYEKRLASKDEGRRTASSRPSPPDMPILFIETFSDPESDAEEATESTVNVMDVGKPETARVPQTTGDPSPETLAAAKSLEKHSTLQKLLKKYLTDPDCLWPPSDIVPDRLKEYIPRPRKSISEIHSEPTRKKARSNPRKAPAVASTSKDRVPKTSQSRHRVTRQKTSSESLGGQDADKGTVTSNERATSRSSGASQRVTRSASRNGNVNGDPRPDRPQAGPSKASTRTRSDSIQPGEVGRSQGRKRVTRAASSAAGCSSGGPTGGSTSIEQPYTQKKYGKRRNAGGKK